MHSVIFVCTANICRSPMACELFRQMVMLKGGETEWKIDSAGTWVNEGQAVSDGTRAILKKRGIDVLSHSAKKVTHELLESFDLILTMERGQKESLQFEFPELRDRVNLMSEMIDQEFNIEDPYGRSEMEFEKTAKLMQKILEDGYQKMVVLSSRSNSTE
jgi:protein arginine phosphatase